MKTKTKRRSSKAKSTPSSVSVLRSGNPFWDGKTIEEIARDENWQPFDPVAFAKSFEHIIPPDEDMGAFVEEIYKART